MSLSATVITQAVSNAIVMTPSATEATIQGSRVSIEEDDCSMNVAPGRTLTDRSRIDHCGELRSAARNESNPDFPIMPLAKPNDGSTRLVAQPPGRRGGFSAIGDCPQRRDR